ncbi:MAG: permease [Petrotogales bacterium]
MKVNQKRRKKERNKNLYYGYAFLAIVILLYFVLSFFNSEKIYRALHASLNIIIQILPVLILVIFLMGIVNYFLKPKMVSKYLGGESGIKGWFLVISMGILSHGPIYVWYPFLKELRDHGMRTGLVAAFLYNRAIKIPLLPIMIYYFGIGFVILLSIYMIIGSVIEGKILEVIDYRFGKMRRKDG